MATLGPVSRDEAVLRALIRAGVDLFRLNLSHGTQEQHRETLAAVRRVAAEEKVPHPGGARPHGAALPPGHSSPDEPRTLKPARRSCLGPEASGADLPVDDRRSCEHLEPGERVLIDGGLIELRVEAKEGDRVRARVVNGGPVKHPQGDQPAGHRTSPSRSPRRTAPTSPSRWPRGADYLAASYVGEARARRGRARRGARRPAGASPSSPSSSAPPPSSTSTRSPRRPTGSWSPAATWASRCRSTRCRCSRSGSSPPAASPASR